MNRPLDQSKFAAVLATPNSEDRGVKFLSYIEKQIDQDTWQQFHDDVFALPANARRLYLPLCFDIGVRGDGMPDAFSFYGYSGDSLVREIMMGFVEAISKGTGTRFRGMAGCSHGFDRVAMGSAGTSSAERQHRTDGASES